MRIDTMPAHAPVADPATGEQRQVAAGLLLMDQPEDDGLTTGWYWTGVPRNPEPEDLVSRQRWTAAVANQQGPFRDANAAFAAAGNHTPETAALAARLTQAAELLRAGEIDATPGAIAEWLGAGGDTQPIGPDPDAKRSADDPDEARRMLAKGEVDDSAEREGTPEDAPLGVRSPERGNTTES